MPIELQKSHIDLLNYTIAKAHLKNSSWDSPVMNQLRNKICKRKQFYEANPTSVWMAQGEVSL